METPVVVGILAVVLIVALRRFAARRVAARDSRFVWLYFAPTILVGVVLMWTSIQWFARDPLLGGAMALIDLGYLAVLVRFVRRFARSVASASPSEDLGSAIAEPTVDFLTTLVGAVLIGGLIVVVALIVLGINQAA